MKNTWKFARIIILTGCLVFLGINAAAHGLEKMSPTISCDFFELNFNDEIVTVTALGRDYQFDAGKTIDRFSYLKHFLTSWGNMLLERGKEYLPYWQEQYRKLISDPEEYFTIRLWLLKFS